MGYKKQSRWDLQAFEKIYRRKIIFLKKAPTQKVDFFLIGVRTKDSLKIRSMQIDVFG